MRISGIMVFVGIIALSSLPALAFYPGGTINSDLGYDNIVIIQLPHALRVTGKLINRTAHTIKASGVIKFCTIQKEVLNSATIKATVPSHGSIQFDRRLENNDSQRLQHAYTIEWDIKDHSRGPKHPKGRSNRHGGKSVGYARTRVSGPLVQIEYQEPKTASKAKTPDQRGATQMPGNCSSAGPVVIKLKNGQTLKADSCWEVDGKVNASLYGGIITFDKKDVQAIIRSEVVKSQE